MANYPIIGKPTRRPDGSYAITVERAPGDKEDVSCADKAQAESTVAALHRAAKILAPRERSIEKVQGPYRSEKGWQVRWLESGQPRRKVVSTRKAAERFRDDLLGTDSPPEKVMLRKRRNFGSVDYFKRILDDSLEGNRVAVNERDYDGAKLTKARITAIREAWQTVSVIMGYAELEDRFEAVMEYLEQHGHIMRKEGAKELQPQTPGLAQALGSDTGPWDALAGAGTAVSPKRRTPQGKAN